MNLDIFCLLILCCGILGVFLKSNLLHTIISFQYILIGFHPFFISLSQQKEKKLLVVIIFLLLITINIFFISLEILAFRRRSTNNNDELRELRG